MGSERVTPCRTVFSMQCWVRPPSSIDEPHGPLLPQKHGPTFSTALTLEASTLFQIRKLFESKPQEESQSQMVMAASIHRHTTTGQHEDPTGPVQGSGDWDDCDGPF